MPKRLERDGINLSGDGQAVDELPQEKVDSKDTTSQSARTFNVKTESPRKTNYQSGDNTSLKSFKKKEEVKTTSSTPKAKVIV